MRLAARPRVRSALHRFLRDELRWEGGVRMPAGRRKVAVLAQFSTSAKLSRSVTELVRELNRNGYYVVMSSACTDPAPIQWHGEAPGEVAVLRKPNVGYDFGSWAVAFAEEPRLLDAEHLLVINDSMLGPFWSLAPVIEHFEACEQDIWGLTQTHQVIPHLQSYFLGFHRSVIENPVFADLWSQVRVEPTKTDVIFRYELGFARAFYVEGFTSRAFAGGQVLARFGENPSVLGWHRLLELGVPLIKREIVTSRGNNAEQFIHNDRIPKQLERDFGIRIAEWL